MAPLFQITGRSRARLTKECGERTRGALLPGDSDQTGYWRERGGGGEQKSYEFEKIYISRMNSFTQYF